MAANKTIKVSSSAGKIHSCRSLLRCDSFCPNVGRVSSVVFLSYLCRPCCRVSAWEMTLVMPAHPSLPLSLRKPDSSSQSPTQPSLKPPHLLPPPHPSLLPPSFTPSPFFSFCDVFSWYPVCSFCLICILLVHQWWWQMDFSSAATLLAFSCRHGWGLFIRFWLSITNTSLVLSQKGCKPREGL